ncbi:hypothetical protein A2153_04890 [Candidatus Gottesmanbacteria bacterium RBG_16_38_7b]|uniref:DUF8173 domain-containing protein n=1 Tax=Candidatus Gottesmanbacteria bacterium RBG_16_38_7b TaxID=1798372 RepID=A0A1F5YLR8_9BACT|nr:MAG: hypothetical protein A2153_04890 [Candidatus Gottesmanbacteria bacterium RBG_16_38_7b]
MKKILLTLLPLFLLLVPVVRAQSPDNAEMAKFYRLSQGEVVDRDLFAAGERVEISGIVNGDLYAAGSQVFIDGTVNGDILAAGGTINFSGKVRDDLRIAGGNITITGLVGKNASIAAGNVELLPGASIVGGLSTLFGNLNQSSPVGTYIRGAGGNINIDNHVGEDAQLAVGSLNVTGNARILGDLTYWSKDKGVIDPQSEITGQTVYHLSKGTPPFQAAKIKKTVITGGRIASLIITFIIGLVYLVLFPRHFKKTLDNLKEKTVHSFIFGILSPFLVLVFCLLLAITIIGIPASIFIFMFYLLLLYLFRIPVIYFLGSLLMKRFAEDDKEIWNLTVGILLYWILLLIPYIGPAASFFVPVFGFGAYLLNFKRTQDGSRSPVLTKSPSRSLSRRSRSGKKS